MSLRDVYRAFGEDSEEGELARRLLEQQHWFTTLADFDPKTGEALPLGLDEVLRRLSSRCELTAIHDRLRRIVDHSRVAVVHLLGSLSESPRREQAMLPVRSVRELNATSFIALNRRPGRNMREKLAGKPYMQAVRRYQSIDLPENRLLKAFASQLVEFLELRQQYLHEEDELLSVLRSWLHGEEAASIGRWENLPPNNTLLSHREYRRVWDAWRWLQNLDDDIDRDMTRLDERTAVVTVWEDRAKKFKSGTVLYGDMPVVLDFEQFQIRPWIDRLPTKPTPPLRRPKPICETSSVCIDITEPRPTYATTEASAATVNDLYLWQRWRRDVEMVDIDLYEADFPMLHPDATTVAMPDLLFRRDQEPALADAASRSFARRLRRTFDSPSLTWLLPDHLNEFQVEVLRRNLNASFPKSEPLPRSVAAVFAAVGYKEIKRDGYAVMVVDQVGGVTTATRLVARIDSELARQAPETKGYYWERTPTSVLERSPDGYDALLTVSHVGADGQWCQRSTRPSAPGISDKDLRARTDLGHFDKLVSVTAPPVGGGVRLHQLRSNAGDLALWRDQVPELSIKVIKDNRYQSFYLVGKDTTIRPVRGAAVDIPVRDEFTLPAGKPHFQFPLFQGSDASDLGYEARIDSSAFPLTRDTACRLRMTYTYGADEPYRLAFEPLDKSFPPVHVKWRPKSDEPITDAPGPEYPTPLTWPELQSHRDESNGKQTDYLDWASRQLQRQLPSLNSAGAIESATIKTSWKSNAKGNRFTFAERAYGDDVYISEFAVAKRATLAQGDEVYFVEVTSGARTEARHVARSRGEVVADVAAAVRRGLYVPFIMIWSNGKSMTDDSCPSEFRNAMRSQLPVLESLLQDNATQESIKREIRFLFACMHRDMPASASQEMVAGLRGAHIDERAYGFALGDLSASWQRDILKTLLAERTLRRLSVLAQAIWRSEALINALDEGALADLAIQVNEELAALATVKVPGKDEVTKGTRLAELLLGLLRSRDSQDPVRRAVLQPGQPITQELTRAVESIADTVERSGLPLRSRVQVGGLPVKPEGDHTPDLLYALRLYLTGDVGANAIRVTGVLDGDDD